MKSLQGHMSDGVNLNINCWKLENYHSLLFLNPQKYQHNGEYYFNAALDLFGGSTRSFLSFQFGLSLDQDFRENKIKNSDLNEDQKKELFDNFYTKVKITNFQVISEWNKTLDEKR